MLVTFYPNGEIRARVAQDRPVERRDRKAKPFLVIHKKLATGVNPSLSVRDSVPSEGKKPGYGLLPKPRPFSVYGRRQLVRAGACFPPPDEKRVVFLTGTLPGGSVAALRAISEWSAWVVHQLQTRIPRSVGCLPIEVNTEWVWEWQRRGALHWHAAVELPSATQAQILIGKFRGIWISTMQGLAKKSGVDIAKRAKRGTWKNKISVWRTDAQLVKKDAGRYMSKYFSKGSNRSRNGRFFCPSRWYSCSRALLKELSRRVVSLPFEHSSDSIRGLVNDDELDFLVLLQSRSHYSVAFGSRWNENATMVFYVEKEFWEEVLSSYRMNPSAAKSEEKKNTFMRKDLDMEIEQICFWPAIEECRKRSFLLDRLFTDLSFNDRASLARYLEFDTGIDSEMFWVNRVAERVLELEGFSLRQSAAPPQGVAEQNASTLEGMGAGASQLGLYPGMPF